MERFGFGRHKAYFVGIHSPDSFAVIKSIVRKREDFAWRFGSVIIDKRGVVWCSTFGEGLYRYNPERRTSLRILKTMKKIPPL